MFKPKGITIILNGYGITIILNGYGITIIILYSYWYNCYT